MPLPAHLVYHVLNTKIFSAIIFITTEKVATHSQSCFFNTNFSDREVHYEKKRTEEDLLFFFSEYLPPLSCPFFSLVGWFKIAQFFLQITFDGSLSRVKARSQFVFNTLLVAFLSQPYKFETSRKAQTNPGNGCRKGCKSKEWYDLHVLLSSKQLLHAVYSLDRRMITTLSAIWAMDDSRIANNNWLDCCLCQNITVSDDDVHSTIDIFVFVDLWKAFVCFGPSLVLLSCQISICERVSSTFVILPTISKMQNISFILFYVVSFLAVQDSSIGDIDSQWVSESVSHFWFQQSRAEQSRALQ